MPADTISAHTRWLLGRSRRKAARRRATVLSMRIQAIRAWMAVAGVELGRWQMRVLTASLREADCG